ncbi:MAG: GNAT family N-acetyltransferase [Anaerolineae bacterium]|nr:GNAT family N-acetyltransferase [Anaerolineae bacterium]
MFPSLFTSARLRLAAPRPDDADILAQWTQDADYLRLLDDDPIAPQSPASFGNLGANSDANSAYFHVRTLDTDRLIGFVVLFNIKWRNQTGEMAIGIGDAAQRGQGYGREALDLLLGYAFHELGLYRVGLTVLDYNIAAIRVYERVGFVREGVQRGAVWRAGARHDLIAYGILRDEWLARQTP